MCKKPSLLRTELCRRWFAGSCGFGRNCWFAHGEDDFRSTTPAFGRHQDAGDTQLPSPVSPKEFVPPARDLGKREQYDLREHIRGRRRLVKQEECRQGGCEEACVSSTVGVHGVPGARGELEVKERGMGREERTKEGEREHGQQRKGHSAAPATRVHVGREEAEAGQRRGVVLEDLSEDSDEAPSHPLPLYLPRPLAGLPWQSQLGRKLAREICGEGTTSNFCHTMLVCGKGSTASPVATAHTKDARLAMEKCDTAPLGSATHVVSPTPDQPNAREGSAEDAVSPAAQCSDRHEPPRGRSPCARRSHGDSIAEADVRRVPGCDEAGHMPHHCQASHRGQKGTDGSGCWASDASEEALRGAHDAGNRDVEKQVQRTEGASAGRRQGGGRCGGGPAAPAGGAPPLPLGWEERWSKKRERPYFYCRETKMTTWDRPRRVIPKLSFQHAPRQPATEQGSGEV